MNNADWLGWYLFLMILCADFILELIAPIIHKEKGKNYSEKFSELRKVEPARDTFSRLYQKKINNPLLPFLFMAMLLVYSSFSLGKYMASTTEDYYILSNNPEKVILRINNDKFIIGNRDTLNNRIYGYSIIKNTENEIAIEERHIGKQKANRTSR